MGTGKTKRNLNTKGGSGRKVSEMNVEELTAAIVERIRIGDETQDEWDYGLEQCWQKEINILSRNVIQTINFIENECDDETFCWLGEVFEDVTELTQSKEFVCAIKKRAEKIVDTEQRRNVEVDIRFAENRLV